MHILKNWLDGERGRGVRLAKHLNVPPSFVTKMATGERPIPFEHGAPIEAFTEQVVTRRELFPNDWLRVWPELAEALDEEEAKQVHLVGAEAAGQQGVAHG